MGTMDLAAARKSLADAHLDGLLLLSPRHFMYATGHSSWFINLYGEAGYGAALIATDASIAPGALISDVEVAPFRATAPEFANVVGYPVWIAYGDIPAPAEEGAEQLFAHIARHSQQQPTVRAGQVEPEQVFDLLVDLIRQLGLAQARLGVEMNFAGPLMARLRAALPGITWVEATPLLELLRAVKSPGEAALLRRGTHLAERGIRAVIDAIRPGMTAGEIARRYRAAVFEAAGQGPGDGGDVLSARITLRVGPYVLQPQAAGSYAVQAGDLVFMDCGVEVAGYWADMGRCFVLGRATAAQRHIYAALRQGFDAATAHLQVGDSPRALFEAGLGAVHAAGLTAYVRGNLGHGIGLHRAPELPILSRQETLVFAPGHVVSVEFPYYLQGVGAFQLEDTFYLPGNLPGVPHGGEREVFNQLTHELVEVG